MNFVEVSKTYTSIIIIATAEHWFQVTTYSLSTGRLRVKVALVYLDIPPLNNTRIVPVGPEHLYTRCISRIYGILHNEKFWVVFLMWRFSDKEKWQITIGLSRAHV